MLRLKLWRLQEGLTQQEAAQRLGVGESTLAILESGRLRPTAGQRERLRAHFGEMVDSLFDPVSEHVEGVL
jgi:transcriptional regulator with XRE-family HTH domain